MYNFTEKNGRDVASLMEWYRRTAAIRVFELFVTSFLPHFGETEALKDDDNFRSFQYRDVAHG